jgi:hypothetical protein
LETCYKNPTLPLCIDKTHSRYYNYDMTSTFPKGTYIE